jgi:hypothetical protein
MGTYIAGELWITNRDEGFEEGVTAGQIIKPNLSLPKDIAQFAGLCDAENCGARFGVAVAATGDIIAGVYPNGMTLEHAMNIGMAIVWGWGDDQLEEAIEVMTKVMRYANLHGR